MKPIILNDKDNQKAISLTREIDESCERIQSNIENMRKHMAESYNLIQEMLESPLRIKNKESK